MDSKLTVLSILVVLCTASELASAVSGGVVTIHTRWGYPMVVTGSNSVVQSRSKYGPTAFLLVPCLAERSGRYRRHRCVSLMAVDRPGWYVRQYRGYLYLQPERGNRNAAYFDLDSSFAVRDDESYDDSYTFESIRYANNYVARTGDGRFKLARRSASSQFRQAASLAVKEFDPLDDDRDD